MDGIRIFLVFIWVSASFVFAAGPSADDPSEGLTPDVQTPMGSSLGKLPPPALPALPNSTHTTSPLPLIAPAPRSMKNASGKEMPPPAEVAVILSQNQFFPKKVHVSSLGQIRLWFTTVDPRPAALIVEGLKVQRWITAELGTQATAVNTEYFEVQRELTREKVTEVTLQPPPGKYSFYDAVSGAQGELIVE